MSIVNTSITVPADSVGFIIGTKGATVNLIKRNTGAWVQIEKGVSPPRFTVRGFPHQVEEACKWIKTIVDESVVRGPPPAPSVPIHQPSEWPAMSASVSTPMRPQVSMPHVPMPHVPMPQVPMQTFYAPPMLGPNQVYMNGPNGLFVYTIPSNVDRTPEEAAHRENVRQLEEVLQADPQLSNPLGADATDEEIFDEYEADTERETARMGYGGYDWTQEIEASTMGDWGGYDSAGMGIWVPESDMDKNVRTLLESNGC